MNHNIRTWMNNKDLHLTIKDIENLSIGDELVILCIDRNFMDCIANNYGQRPMVAAHFFNESYILTYKHEQDLHGKVKFRNLSTEFRDFNFDLEFKKDNWYPLNDLGFLPEADQQGLMNFIGCERDYRNYPDNTRIGWRGPMVIWSTINSKDTFSY